MVKKLNTHEIKRGGINHPDHNERKALWDIRDSLHGKLLKFRYFGYGAKPNEDGQIVPRFPRALGLRHPIDI